MIDSTQSECHLGLMRLATVMMSLRLAGALTFAPEPIVMATSFSVRVWQICEHSVYSKYDPVGQERKNIKAPVFA